MSHLPPIMAAILAATALASPVFAQAQVAAAMCDALAASPYDPETPEGEGIAFADIEPISAIEACLDAAKAFPDNPKIRFQLARAYDLAEDWEKAYRHYEAAIAGESLVASTALGHLYELGLGVEPDAARAAALYQPAAEAGVLPAIENLGKLYEDGRGVEQDYEQAAELYREAVADQSYWAMGALGWLTENGWGVEQDLAEAARLYTAAADEGGLGFAQNNIASFYADGLGPIAEDDRKAVAYYTKAAEQGFVLAYINLSLHYSEGQGVKRSLAKAEDWLRRAIAEGTDDERSRAQNNLAWMFVTETIKLDEAVTLARASVAVDPTDPSRIDTLAWALHLTGKSEEALPLMEQAITLSNEDPILRAHLATIKAALDK